MGDRKPTDAPGAPGRLESTASLLERARRGDADGRDLLVRRFLPALRRWARGRLPAGARDLLDTDDLVQVTFLRALDQVDRFEHRRPGGFLAYLRSILQNQIRDQLRRAGRRPSSEGLPEDLREAAPSPLEVAIGREALESYELALRELTPEQQEAVLLRVELGFTYPEIAEAMGGPSPNAARMLVARGLVRLAEIMDAKR